MKYFKELIAWFWEGKYFYLFLIIIAFTFLLNKIDINLLLSEKIKIYGLVLQITGALTLVYTLKERLILFKGHGLGKLFKDYFKRFPGRKSRRKIIFKGYPVNVSTSTGEAHLKVSPKDELKDIIRYFEEEIDYLHNIFNKFKKETSDHFSKVKDELINIDHKLSNELKETKRLISASSVSNVWLELFGISCIIFGLICSTVPEIIERII